MSSLATKLGLRPGQLVRLLEAPEEAVSLLSDIAPLGVEISVEEAEEDAPRSDLLFFWPYVLEGLVERFSMLQGRIVPDGAIWVVMPKKAVAARHGITFSWEQMQAAALATDLVDNKIASFSAEEYATRLVIRREQRHKYYCTGLPDGTRSSGLHHPLRPHPS
jgi:hypothetical protein